MTGKVFCGIEGGASISKLVLVDDSTNVLCSIDGPSTNYLLVGLEECHKRLTEMIERAKKEANLKSDIVLDGLGLCMSGCEETSGNEECQRVFMKNYPNLTRHCVVTSDTLGPLYTASRNGGLVLIAGTGSNSLLVNPDGTTGRCGGWGHLVGDEASAMWISLRAVKILIDNKDNMVKCPYSTAKVEELTFQHFNVTDLFGLLEHIYAKFNKSFFARLCAKLAAAASIEKDPLCCHLFYEAGKELGKMVVALKPKVHKELLESEIGLPIVCVGSVFKSWHLLERGFKEHVNWSYDKYTLMTLNCSSAIGAACLGAKSTGYELPINHEKNTSVLYSYHKK